MFADSSIAMAPLIRTLFISVVLFGLAAAGYWKITTDQQAKTIAELRELTAEMQNRLDERQAMIERLSRSRRIAHVHVLDQEISPTGSIERTKLDFIELDDRGAELARQQFSIPGDVVYIDAWTVKFEHEAVAEGNPLTGQTLVLLRRVYSDRLAPKDGFLIDTPGAIPPGYAASDAGIFEKRLWENFWAIATDASLAKRMGVRVAQGEAAYKPVRAGQAYELIVDAAGGINLTPMPSKDDALTKVND